MNLDILQSMAKQMHKKFPQMSLRGVMIRVRMALHSGQEADFKAVDFGRTRFKKE